MVAEVFIKTIEVLKPEIIEAAATVDQSTVCNQTLSTPSPASCAPHAVPIWYGSSEVHCFLALRTSITAVVRKSNATETRKEH